MHETQRAHVARSRPKPKRGAPKGVGALCCLGQPPPEVEVAPDGVAARAESPYEEPLRRNGDLYVNVMHVILC